MLCTKFTQEEIQTTMFDMHPSKAIGMDGYTAIFYQKLWPIIGKDITKAALTIFNDHGGLADWNDSLIALD